MVTQTGYMTLGLLMSLAGFFELESRATPARIKAIDTPNFGSGQSINGQ